MDRRALVRRLKLHGLTVDESALVALEALLASSKRPSDVIVTDLLKNIERSLLVEGRLTADVIRRLEETLAPSNDTSSDSSSLFFRPINAFSTPKFRYKIVSKSFILDSEPSSIFGTADDKVDMYCERYWVVQQRLTRHPLFSQSKLTPTDALGERYVLGFLVKMNEGEFFLEDTKGQIKLDLSRLKRDKRSSGLFVPGSLVVVKGLFLDEILHVDTLSLPPYESSQATKDAFPGVDFFGEAPPTRLTFTLLRQQEQRIDTNMYILSDVHLDQPSVILRLRTLFVGLRDNDVLPNVFVFMGNFTSRPFGHEEHDMRRLQEHFKSFAELLSQFTSIARKSAFVFVPGPTDIGPHALPRPPLRSFFTQPLSDTLRNVTFATNPCRLRIGLKTVVLFRDNLTRTMRQAAIHEPVNPIGEERELAEHLLETLACSAHLCPVPDYERAVHWTHDQSLRLYPLPDTLVIAEDVPLYENSFDQCLCFNPGSFAFTSTFANFEPFKNVVEFGEVPTFDAGNM